MASGEPIEPGKHYAVQEKFPQLFRLFASTHESFHFVDDQLGLTKAATLKKFPQFERELALLTDPQLNSLPLTESIKREESVLPSVSNEFVKFHQHRSEVFADAAAAVYLLDKTRDPQTRDFLTAWKEFREAAAVRNDDYSHLSAKTITAVIDAYDKGVKEGTIVPGKMTARDAAAFVRPFVEKGLDETRSVEETMRLWCRERPETKVCSGPAP